MREFINMFRTVECVCTIRLVDVLCTKVGYIYTAHV